MSAPPLTPHQHDALCGLLRLAETERVVAQRGLAGTGKTTLIPHISAALPNATVAAMTHKAVSVLKAKGVTGARTLHSACLKPIFSNAYLELLAWFTAPDAFYPSLLRHVDRAHAHAVVVDRYEDLGPEGCARALGVDPSKEIIGWEQRNYVGGTIVIDEASMTTVEHVLKALKVFDRIILVGDNGQLPPVKGAPALELADGVELHELHRQAESSPIVKLAHGIRNGAMKFWELSVDGGLDPDAGPIITWTNPSRIKMSLAMRRLKGLRSDRLERGEPIVCKSNDREHRRLGFRNNVAGVYLGDGTVEIDGRRLRARKIHVDDLCDRPPSVDEIPFRLGYALTAHTAQGSEWPRAQVYYPDVVRMRDTEFRKKWLYTSITRAKTSVRFFRT